MKDFPQIPANTVIYAIGYARVSDRKQEEEGDSLETQEKAIRKYAISKGWILTSVVKEVFSGFYLRERIKLTQDIRQAVRERTVQVVIINSFDRLSREPIHQAVLLNEMLENNVRLESITEPLDTSPLSSFLRQALAFAAAIEREKIIERNVRGVQNKIDKGQMIGTGSPKYGYAWGDEKHTFYTIEAIEAMIVNRIFELYVIEHISIRGIAAKLHMEGVPNPSNRGDWGTTTVTRILKDKFYIGEGTNRRLKWEYVDGKRKEVSHPNPTPLPEGVVPPIVTKDIWYAAQEKRRIAKQEAKRNNREPEKTLLRAGYIHCGYCGRAMTVVRYNREAPSKKQPSVHYRCGAVNVPNYRTCQKTPTITVGKIDKIVWDFVKDILEEIEGLREILQSEPSSTVDELKSLNQIIRRTEEEQERTIIDIRGLSGRARDLMIAELNRLEDNLQKLHEEKDRTIPYVNRAEQAKIEVEEFFRWCVQIKGKYEGANYEEKRLALRLLGISVKVYKATDKEHEQYTITARPEIIDKLPTFTQTERETQNSFNCEPTWSHTATL